MANFNIDYLVVAGGGGGSGGYGGSPQAGGGAGGLRTSWGSLSGGGASAEATLSLVTGTNYTVTIGAGGVGAVNTSAQIGSSGGTSEFGAITTVGGGGARNWNSTAASGSGGSGGGEAYSTNGGPGSGTANQGFSGGAVAVAGPGAGGGGAGSAGSWSSASLGIGGNGINIDITGSTVSYAGGGGRTLGTPPGGGGQSAASPGAGGNGTANTGGGGGGGNGTGGSYIGGNGGSGIVILRYATADANYTATGLTPTETIDGTDTILSFTTVGTGTITFTPPPPPPFSGNKVTTPVTDFNKPNTEEGLKIPSGTASEQPTGVEGMVRNDTNQSSKGSSSAISYYNGTNWRYFENEIDTNFNTVLYTGTSLTNAITGVGFSPDLVWLKQRDSAQNHGLFDTVRGTNNFIMSNSTSAENTRTTDTLSSFDADGFTLTPYSSDAFINYTGRTMVAWCFKAGGLINKSAYFNGNGYIATGYTAITGTSASISSWINIEAYTTYGAFVGDSTGQGNAARFFIGQGAGTSGNLWVSVGNGTSVWYDDTSVSLTSYGLNKWFHLAGTVDGTTVKIYINGNLVYTYTSSVSYVGAGTFPYYLGGWGNALRLQGKLNQVRFFNSALTSSEVTQLYNETKADNSVLNFPSGAGCVAAYPLGENANGLDGLYNGTPYSITFGKPGYLTRNTEGTIESTVSANNDLGFSIVSYTGNGTAGSTVGHGLDSTPEMVIVKSLTTTANQSWSVYQVDVGNNGSLTLELGNPPYYDIGYWNNTSPTSSVFTLGYYAVSNQNNADYIAYCFASKPNYSKVGSYVGDSTTSNKIYTGFEPAFVMMKSTGTANWLMVDNKRIENNGNLSELFADTNSAESGTGYDIDFDIDSFTLNTNTSNANTTNQTYIYLAFANTI